MKSLPAKSIPKIVKPKENKIDDTWSNSQLKHSQVPSMISSVNLPSYFSKQLTPAPYVSTCMRVSSEDKGTFLTACPSRQELNLSHSTSIKSLIRLNLKDIDKKKNSIAGEKFK